MYRGFNIQMDDIPKDYASKGRLTFVKNYEKSIKSFTQHFIDPIDGDKLEEDWFPLVDCDIFLSHSHDDIEDVLAFAGYLEVEFELKVFIDYCLWGKSDVLLKSLDDVLSKIENSTMYSYDKRNRTTAHVHMMLAVALSKMIDKSECLFFFNTPNSIKVVENVKKTDSPWLYLELITSKLINKKRHRPLRETLSYSKASEEVRPIRHRVDLGHLNNIDNELIKRWHDKYKRSNSHALDILYDLSPPKVKEHEQ